MPLQWFSTIRDGSR